MPRSSLSSPSSEHHGNEWFRLPIINMIGGKVALGPLIRDLIPLLTHWSNDFAARMNIGTPLPRTLNSGPPNSSAIRLARKGLTSSSMIRRPCGRLER
jgi:hypothetical protein